MATKKQRRRREKGKRHEYEYVYVDEEGREVDVDEQSVAKPTPRVKGGNAAKAAAPARRGRRTVEPPSWRRSVRRGLIFAPIFLALILLINGDRQSLAASIINAVILLVVFVPFSYFLDRLFYRTFQKRVAGADGS